MKKEQYIRRVLKGIKVPDIVKKRINNDLQTEFENKEEAGLTVEEIISQKGTSQEVAEEFNQAYSNTMTQKQYYTQKSLKIASTVLIVLSLLIFVCSIFLSKDTELGIIGGTDGPTVFVSNSPGMLLVEIAGVVTFIGGCVCVLVYCVKRRIDNRC